MAAARIELEPIQDVVVLRVARNAGFSKDVLGHLESIAKTMTRVALKGRSIRLTAILSFLISHK